MPGNDFTDLQVMADPTVPIASVQPFQQADTQIAIAPNDLRDGLRLADINATFYPPGTIVGTTAGSAVAVTTYRMRGYYGAGSTYEYWLTTDPTSAPPSGHSLVAIVIEARLR